MGAGGGPGRSPHGWCLPVPSDWLTRYRAGEHEQVWLEICSLGADIRQDEESTKAAERVRSGDDVPRRSPRIPLYGGATTKRLRPRASSI
jgi:hypothetical protein